VNVVPNPVLIVEPHAQPESAVSEPDELSPITKWKPVWEQCPYTG
jgi:hypothetical protein